MCNARRGYYWGPPGGGGGGAQYWLWLFFVCRPNKTKLAYVGMCMCARVMSQVANTKPLHGADGDGVAQAAHEVMQRLRDCDVCYVQGRVMMMLEDGAGAQ